jgi:hypothetical protein
VLPCGWVLFEWYMFACSQGLWYAPVTLSPLVDSPAMHNASRLYSHIASAACPASFNSCAVVHEDFLAGSCAM